MIVVVVIAACPSSGDTLTVGEYCYQLSTSTADWTTARDACDSSGGDLIWFSDAQEHDVITQWYCSSIGCSGTVRFWTGS